MDFFIQDWAFWMQKQPDSANGEQTIYPVPSEITAIQRRRLSELTKITLHLSFSHTLSANTPVVFSSRHGDLHKTSLLLQQVALNEDLSPTQFALSVHNSMVGQYSILKQHQAQHSSIAAGDASLHYGILEAWSLLQCNDCEQVLVVYADQKLPEIYQNFDTHPAFDHGMSLLLNKKPVGTRIRLQRQASKADSRHDEAIELHNFLQSDALDTKITTTRDQWFWQRVN